MKRMASGKEDGRYGSFKPGCNIDTVKDGRGGIFTWVPKELIKEIDLVYITPGLGKEDIQNDFTEYFLMVDGSGVMVFQDPEGHQEIHHMSRGDCVYCTPGIVHSFHAITPAVSLMLRSKALGEASPLGNEMKFGMLHPSCNMETVIKKREGRYYGI
jgi:mannose-6-phosphate isomerase-like protein (cupin superfamily)